MLRIFFCLSGILLVSLSILSSEATYAGGPQTVQCGDIIESEFVLQPELHLYYIELAPGDQVTVSGEVLGETLTFSMVLANPSQSDYVANTGYWPESRPQMTSPVVSAGGIYTIAVANHEISSNFSLRNRQYGTGLYTIYISCVLRDGTVILPGDTSRSSSQTDVQNQSPSDQAQFSGFGFPGLAPVDFTNAALLPLSPSAAFNGAITPSGGEILGYTLDLNASQTVDLTVTRLSGNLNLSIVVLDAESRVAFQASLIASTGMTTQFVAPNTGTYTFGVFRVDVNPPTQPAATAFSLIVSPVE